MNADSSQRSAIKIKIRDLPESPGVYLMKDVSGKIIYVGKAKSLKSRVASYFVANIHQHSRTTNLVRRIASFDVILTATEVEALLTERTLIRHHNPTFNVLLRDDKEFPYIRVDFNESWPRIEKVRKRKDDGAVYLGPFGKASHLAITLKALGKIFPLIRCSRHEFRNARKPCTYFHMKMCLAPCSLEVDHEQYRNMIRHALSYLQGRDQDLRRQLKGRMLEASCAEQYELAAQYRDQLSALDGLAEKQVAVVDGLGENDVIGLAREHDRICFYILMVRDGRVTGHDTFLVKDALGDNAAALSSFVLQYYDSHYVPPSILLPENLDDSESLELLYEQANGNRKVSLLVPKRGPRKDLIDIAMKNAVYALADEMRQSQSARVALEVLQQRLALKAYPRRIEAFDISNLHATAVVASQVCFVDGKPSKAHYRHYSIHAVRDSTDDYASMKEVIARRLARARAEGDLPDLIVIDGGRGQLNAALAAKNEFQDLDVELIGLAKSRADKASTSTLPGRSFERVFKSDGSAAIALPVGSPEFRLLTQLRDEAHRFAISHHRSARTKQALRSELDDVAGIGPKLRTRLLQRFESVEKMAQVSLERLLEVPGLKESVAVALHSFLQSRKTDLP